VAGIVIADYQGTRVRKQRSQSVLNIQKENSELTIRDENAAIDQLRIIQICLADYCLLVECTQLG